MTNLLDLAPGALSGYFADRGEKPFHARQVSRWIHQRFVADFGAMTDLRRALRERLAAEAEVRGPAVVRDTTAADGTRKWLLDAGNGNAVESVYIPEDDRGTLCISSQAGLRARLRVLLDRQAGLQPQPDDGRDHRPALAREPRAARRRGHRTVDRARPAADHERRDDGHGRAARQFRQRRAGAASSCSTTTRTDCRAGASRCRRPASCR